jgi:hypothetical protein
MGEGRSLAFEKRGHEVQRIETFSDAVFAFAVTLLIVSLEVPKNFEELMVSMLGFYAFGISFTLLALIWYDQHVYPVVRMPGIQIVFAADNCRSVPGSRR